MNSFKTLYGIPLYCIPHFILLKLSILSALYPHFYTYIVYFCFFFLINVARGWKMTIFQCPSFRFFAFSSFSVLLIFTQALKNSFFGFALYSLNFLNWLLSLIFTASPLHDHFSFILQVLICNVCNSGLNILLILLYLLQLINYWKFWLAFCDWFLILCYSLLVMFFSVLFSVFLFRLQNSYNICMLFRASWKSYQSLSFVPCHSHQNLFVASFRANLCSFPKVDNLPSDGYLTCRYSSEIQCQHCSITYIGITWYLFPFFIFFVWTCLAPNSVSH